jgi:transposase InsO family protein
VRLFTLADEIGVRPACRAMGVHHSTYYRLKRKVDRWGLEALRIRERRRPRMPNQIGPHLEQRVIAFSLANPGFGARRISAELAREKWGGRLQGTKGTVWQYTAADVASGFAWAELHATPKNPRSRFTREPVHRVARELKAAGWKLGEVTTDNGSEFRAREFTDAVAAPKARRRPIKAGRPDSNGCVERLQLTILEECWRPAFARSLAPRSTALERDLEEYLRYFNHDRAHTGRPTKGPIPADIVFGARKTRTVR